MTSFSPLPFSSFLPKTYFTIPLDNTDLNNELTCLAGHLNAAQYRFLKLLAALVERKAWGGGSGIKSPAHWLNYYCGIALGAAREKVRVALCLNALPLIDKAFQSGEISYSKVRAMTRSATVENEAFLLRIARHGTAQHLEILVRKYQRVKRLNNDEGPGKNQHQAREFSSYIDDDGMLVFQGKLAPEEGAVFLKALQASFHQFNEKNVPAETSKVAAEAEPKASCTQQRVDALVLIAEHFLATAKNNTGVPLSNGDKYQVVVHIEVKSQERAQTTDRIDSACKDEPTKAVERGLSAQAYLDNGLSLSPETVRRLAADASLVTVLENTDGTILNVGRKTRIIPPAIRRALTQRDHGCRYPGCCESRYVDAHHIQHWCDGGETSLGNLVLLCRHHHRLLHEGGFVIQHLMADNDGIKNKAKKEINILFMSPDGKVIPDSVYPQFDPLGITRSDELAIERQNKGLGLDIDAETAITQWQGESMDYDLAIGALFKY